jgi:metallophosphoesterase (TIGR00282 family)
MRIVCIGDINGRAGRVIVRSHLPRLIAQREIDFAIGNVENAADGFGVTPEIAEQMFDSGFDCLTSGNHIWDKREIIDYLREQPRLLRPLNYPDGVPGVGLFSGEVPAGIPIIVINLMGRVFMPPCDNPFRVIDQTLSDLDGGPKVIVVDMHAEATSEKNAMGWHLDGRVTAVVGTHTHVQTADERILPGGTAYITDLGMTGPYESVIGIQTDLALKKFLTGVPVRFSAAKRGVRLCGVFLDVDENTGRARTIERIQLPSEPGHDGGGGG